MRLTSLRPTSEALADAGPGQPPELALRAAGQLFTLKDDITSARAMTNGPGIPDLGDARLWESLSAALDRAGSQLLSLILQLVKIKNWSLNSPPAAEHRTVVKPASFSSSARRTALLIRNS